MQSFEVRGGKKLFGEITPQGAKNEALQIISAVLLSPEKITISNIPDIVDVNLLIELLGEMKVKIDRQSRDTCIFQADDVDVDYLHSESYPKKSGKLRGSVMLASMAAGTTSIYNAACEPYLQQLCKMLNRMGAKISGIGSNMLTITGVDALGGTEHRMLPDMIEVGSFIGLAAMTQSDITIKINCFITCSSIQCQGRK